MPDDHLHSRGAASPGGLLQNKNILNRLKWSMNHQDLTNTCAIEQFQGSLLFSGLGGPLMLDVGRYKTSNNHLFYFCNKSEILTNECRKILIIVCGIFKKKNRYNFVKNIAQCKCYRARPLCSPHLQLQLTRK